MSKFDASNINVVERIGLNSLALNYFNILALTRINISIQEK